jgi:hypothetical protein
MKNKNDEDKIFLEKMDKRIRKTNQLADDIIKLFELLDQHLKPCGNDLTLLAIKGHLVIESFLEMNLCRLLEIDALPKGKGRLGFKQKLQLVEEVVKHRVPGPNSPNSSLCIVIDKLNDVRNSMAHKLTHQAEIEKDVEGLVKEYHLRAGKKLVAGQTLAEQLKGCIRELCTFLCKARVHFFKLELPSSE